MIKEKKLNVWLINTKRIIRKLIGDLHMHMPVERRSECVYTCRRGVIIYWSTTSRRSSWIRSGFRRPDFLAFLIAALISKHTKLGRTWARVLLPRGAFFLFCTLSDHGKTIHELAVLQKRTLDYYIFQKRKQRGSQNIAFARTDANTGQKSILTEPDMNL